MLQIIENGPDDVRICQIGDHSKLSRHSSGTPKCQYQRVRLALGEGTSAARRAMKSSGLNRMWVVPIAEGMLELVAYFPIPSPWTEMASH